MLKPAIFLDRDGTIIQDTGCIGGIDDVVFFSFSFDALRELQKRYLLFIVTNQSCVGLKKVTHEAATRVNDFVLSMLAQNGIAIQQLYCCAHTRDNNCECIKPKPYFLHKAREEFGVDLGASFTVGDHPHDVLFGENAGATGLYVLTGHGEKHKPEVAIGTKCFSNLHAAALWILNQPAQNPPMH
jgi:histidinol-phosphate phosphatase family protein